MPPPQGSSGAPRGHPPGTLWLAAAFAAVYVIWGSTYLAIRFAIESIPPLLMAGVRFTVAGGILYVWSRARGAPRPTPAQWLRGALAGGLMLLGGNGAVVLAEEKIPSGLVALLVAVVPLWMVLLDWLWGGRVRPTGRVIVGLVAGLAGVGLLVGAPGLGDDAPEQIVWGGVVLLGALSWAGGSLVSRYAADPPRPRMWVAILMLSGGLLLGAAGGAAGEFAALQPAAVTVRSALALLYLIVFGSVVAYGAYIWLLGVSTPARVSTYAYVNPAVALFLGWALAGEPLAPRTLLAASVIVGAVALITSAPPETSAA